VGNELNIIKKHPSRVQVRWVLVFPDLYELGMSYLGFGILYHILNAEEFVAAERVYAPWIDFEDLLRRKRLPLFSLETKTPLREFDIVGFTLQYELQFTNVLNILDLSGIPIFSKERTRSDPLVIAGGPCAFNPEPMADFIDAFVIGDGEEVVVEISHLLREARHKKADRRELLRELAQLKGVYVPQFYEVSYIDGRFDSIEPLLTGVPPKISARMVKELRSEYYPLQPLVPLIKTTHDRLSIEIMRGCTRGCRFCNAGMIYRPLRERSVEDLIHQALRSLDSTGYEELSLVSLSTSDYSHLDELLSELRDFLRRNNIALSVPSLRPETFTPQLAGYLKEVRKSGLTLAPEAGTERLRRVINKVNTDEEILRAVEVAFSQGWDLIKLYFMIGLPTETEADLEGIIRLVREMVTMGRRYGGKSINLSISPFSPKPHTPFQWEAQNTLEEFSRKISLLQQGIRFRNVELKWRDPNVSSLEAVMARGDRRLSQVVYRAWRMGAKFDAWTDLFNGDIWTSAFQDCGIDPREYLRKREVEEKLPWDHIDKGILKSFLIREREKALRAQPSQDCRIAGCLGCGLMDQPPCQVRPGEVRKGVPERAFWGEYGRSPRKIPSFHSSPHKYRLKYSKGWEVRFTSHLDTITAIHRAFKRAKVPLAYSKGYHPHPKISFGPPLAMGHVGLGEYLDFQIEGRLKGEIECSLSQSLPRGYEVLEIKPVYGNPPSLSSVINRAEYEVDLNPLDVTDNIREHIADFFSKKEVIVEHRGRDLNMRPFVEEINYEEEGKRLRFLIKFIEGKTVRVEELLREILALSKEQIALLNIIRTGLFIKMGERLLTPMEIL